MRKNLLIRLISLFFIISPVLVWSGWDFFPKNPLVIKGDLIYYGNGNMMKVLRVEDLTYNNHKVVDSNIQDILIEDLIYLITERSLYIIEPKDLNIISKIEISREEIESGQTIKKYGNFVYIASGRQGVLRVDISDPRAPKISGRIEFSRYRGIAKDIDRYKDRLYVACYTGVGIIDLNRFELLRFIETEKSAERILVKESYCLIGSRSYYFLIDTEKGELRKEIPMIDPFYYTYPYRMKLYKDLVYIANGEGGLYVLNWKEKENPFIVSQYGCWTSEKGKIYYILARGIDIKDEKNVFLADCEGIVYHLTLKNDEVYFVDKGYGFKNQFNISSPFVDIVGKVEKSGFYDTPFPDFYFLLDTGTEVVSRETTTFCEYKFGPTYTNLKVNWEERPIVRIIGVNGIDRSGSKFRDLNLDSKKVITALIVFVKLGNEWKPYYINNWFHTWRGNQPGLESKDIVQFYIDKGYDVFGWINSKGNIPSEGIEKLEYDKKETKIVYHGKIVSDKESKYGYKLKLLHFWVSTGGGQYKLIYGSEENLKNFKK